MNSQSMENISPEEKRIRLYLDQVNTLKIFLEHNTITQAQFDKSFNDLTEKMGMKDVKARLDMEKD